MILFLAAAVLEDFGDLELFYRLFDKYKNKMFNNAYAILRDRHLAEDAMHDAFMSILRNFATVKSLSDKERAVYFAKSARNTAINYLHKLKVQWDNELPLDEHADACGEWDGTFAAASRAIDMEAVKKALNMIAPDMRNLILLCIAEEKSITEAANLLGCPRTTLEYRLNKAKKCFAKEYLKITGDKK